MTTTRTLLAVLLAILFLSLSNQVRAACPQHLHSDSVTVGGKVRTFDYLLPIDCDTNQSPVILDLHPLGGTSEWQRENSGMELMRDAGYVVIWPQGHANAWNAGILGPYLSQEDDVEFLFEVVVKLWLGGLAMQAEHLHATGLSNGGAMSHKLACEASDWIASVVPVSMYLTGTCNPPRAVSVLAFHGTADDTAPYDPNAGLSLERWGAINGCLSGPTTDIDPPGAGYSTAMSGCNGGTVSRLNTIGGGEHNLYDDATAAGMHIPLWSGWFFNAHPHPGRS